MAALDIREPVEGEIGATYERLQRPPKDSPTLRASGIGEECSRRLWYELRWTISPAPLPGRLLRLFETGHIEEARLLDDLRKIGVKIEGQQEPIPALADGWLTGHPDGIGTGIPGAPKTPHLIECKTHNDANFKLWRRQGVKTSHPKHYAQMQIYMHALKLTRALYICVNKNTDEIGAQRVQYDPLEAARLVVRAEGIVAADWVAPPKISAKPDFYLCTFCDFRGVCHGEQIPRRNCRTCMHFTMRQEACGLMSARRSLAEQREGCAMHRYLPAIINLEQTDADPEAGVVRYRRKDGSEFVDQ